MVKRKKSWNELLKKIDMTMKRWGGKSYILTPMKPPASRNAYHSSSMRKVTIQFAYMRPIILSASLEFKAHDNLECLASALEVLRISALDETENILLSAYRQVYPVEFVQKVVSEAQRRSSGEQQKDDPFAVLGVGRNYPTEIIKTIWLAKLKVEHPDSGGSHEAARDLNAAWRKIKEMRGV